jgi:hypothetical protein
MSGEAGHMERATGCPGPLALDRWWLAGAPQGHPLHEHVRQCEVCRAQVAANQAAAQVVVAEVLPALGGVQAERPGAWSGLAEWWRGLGRGWALAGGLAALVLVLGVWGLMPRDPDLAVAFKGPIGLEVYGHRDQATFRVSDGDRLRPGDRLRFRVTTPGPGYLLILSVEEGGRVTRFYPFASDAAQSFDGRGALLEGSIALDSFLGRERVFVLFSPAPFSLREVSAAAASLAATPGGVGRARALPVPFDQASLGFVKAAPGVVPGAGPP